MVLNERIFKSVIFTVWQCSARSVRVVRLKRYAWRVATNTGISRSVLFW